MMTHRFGITRISTLAFSTILATSATAGQLHVPQQYRTIQAAVDAASGGDEIVVAPGVYNETIDIVSRSNLTLRGSGGAEATILDGTDLGRSMVRIEAGSTGIVFDGFTFRNSDSEGGTLTSGATFACCGFNGGAMMVRGESDVTINHCVFRDNVLDVPQQPGLPPFFSRGAALAVIEYSSATICDSFFINNRLPGQQVGAGAGAAIYVNVVSSITVTATEFYLNSVTNGQITSEGGAVAFRNDEGGSSGTFLNCTFSENDAARGGAIMGAKAHFTVVDCEFHNNVAAGSLGSRGGAIYVVGEGSDLVVEACEFTGNVAVWGGSAIQGTSLALSVTDSRFCNNTTADDITLSGSSPPLIDGGGNIILDDCPPDPKLGDLNDDGVVNLQDLIILINNWGPCPGGTPGCLGDLNNNGTVGLQDLITLINNWG